jgi:hypothetical protein
MRLFPALIRLFYFSSEEYIFKEKDDMIRYYGREPHG